MVCSKTEKQLSPQFGKSWMRVGRAAEPSWSRLGLKCNREPLWLGERLKWWSGRGWCASRAARRGWVKKLRTQLPNKAVGHLVTAGHFVWGRTAGTNTSCVWCVCTRLLFPVFSARILSVGRLNCALPTPLFLCRVFFALLVVSISCTMRRMSELLQLRGFDQR